MTSSAQPAPHQTPDDDPLDRLDRLAERHDVPCADGHVAWRRFGEGPPVVLLHGGHGSWRHWVRNIDALAGLHSVWVADMPGYGDSSRPAQRTLPAISATLQQSLDALLGHGTPVDLVGFSFGAMVGAHLAVQRGGVKRLALLGMAGHGQARRPRGELHNWREAHASGEPETLRGVMRWNLQQQMLHQPSAIDELALRIHTESCLLARFHSRTISRTGGTLETLDRWRAPLLLVWGEHDITAVPEEINARVLADHPEREALVLPGAGHWVMYEAAPAVNERLLRFLSSSAAH